MLKEVDVECGNKWSVSLLEGGDQGSPIGIFSVAVETKSVDGVEAVRVIKINLRARRTDLMMLNDQATKCQVKFNGDKCKVMKKGEKNSNCTGTVLCCCLLES